VRRWAITTVRHLESIASDLSAQPMKGCAVYFFYKRDVTYSNDLYLMVYEYQIIFMTFITVQIT
jgi:hypothetical protein